MKNLFLIMVVFYSLNIFENTTYLFCKLYMNTTCIGIRVQTLIKKGIESIIIGGL